MRLSSWPPCQVGFSALCGRRHKDITVRRLTDPPALPSPPSETASQGSLNLLDSWAPAQLGATTSAVTAAVQALLLQGGVAASQAAGDVSDSVDGLAHQLLASLELLQANGAGGHSFVLLALITPALMAVVAATAPRSNYDGYTELLHPDDLPSLSASLYSAEIAADYFRRRPVAVAHRAAEVAAEAARFGASLLLDLWTGRLKANEQARAMQLRAAIERLGPAYIKVAQAVSTRADLLTPAYFTQIQLLQAGFSYVGAGQVSHRGCRAPGAGVGGPVSTRETPASSGEEGRVH